LEQISLGDFEFWPEKLIQVSEPYFPTGNLQFNSLDLFGNLNPAPGGLCLTSSARVFSRMIIAMCFGNHCQPDDPTGSLA
jgi:hypothetical protein